MTVGEAVQMVRRLINQTIKGGPGEMLRAFKAFRFKSGSDDNQVSDETLPFSCSFRCRSPRRRRLFLVVYPGFFGRVRDRKRREERGERRPQVM